VATAACYNRDMKTRAAVLWGTNQPWQVEEVEIDPPRVGEVLVKWSVAGLCHSDEHLVTGDMVPPPEALTMMGIDDIFPMIGGHEGAGVVVEVGEGVSTLKAGDHVSASFIPSCGRCRYCSTGKQNLCDNGRGTFGGGMITDGTHRHFVTRNGKKEHVGLMAKVGTFAEHACVAENSLIKVDDDLPLECVALVSCGVATGWGSATNRAEVHPGETVVVVGIGGIGINAVQGAKMAGAKRVIAVDPVEFKREKAMEFGATHTFASMEEALPEVMNMTEGQMADKVIMTPGVMYGDLMALGMSLTGKGGTIVVTAVAPMTQTHSAVNLFELAMWNKEIKGTIFGSLNPRADIPRLLGMYRDGTLKLDELITKRYSLDDINVGYEAMRNGENIRGVIVYD
jgi:NDMA-dependent alcohol dehydrogenase